MADLKKIMEQLVDLGIEFQDINDAYVEAFHAKEARDKRAADLNNKREAVINALNNYVEAIYGKRMSVNDLRELSTEFQTIEKNIAALENSSIQFTRDEQEKKEKGMSDEEKLRNFLRAALGE
jgi:predicted  nucleic acid-binding Zn-ribbon protein